jgi:hypothetical protein
MLDSMSSSTRRIAIPRSRNSPSPVEFMDAVQIAVHRYGLDERPSRETQYRFRSTSPRTCRDPSGSIDSTHPICLDSRILFTLCSQGQGVHQTPDVRSHGRGMMRLRSVNWSGDELPNCFWSAVGWVVLCLAPYVYALNDLITWR